MDSINIRSFKSFCNRLSIFLPHPASPYPFPFSRDPEGEES